MLMGGLATTPRTHGLVRLGRPDLGTELPTRRPGPRGLVPTRYMGDADAIARSGKERLALAHALVKDVVQQLGIADVDCVTASGVIASRFWGEPDLSMLKAWAGREGGELG
jgi:hypothetical protein